jgi:hypothetical protein
MTAWIYDQGEDLKVLVRPRKPRLRGAILRGGSEPTEEAVIRRMLAVAAAVVGLAFILLSREFGA